ncbi:molybdenum cofactor synthesis domain-containing protein [Williamwhitmania taraxaci]|uniref:Molybdopterin adenylyltransferase n=2 Tax=Williamwhitmania taraxaci TaxID=1640674 RepID=A0A1G6KBA3_9BACT|nr:molybdenum cofactor synthesis domain-containing protein [Williamwhitmania taraxaci]
MVKKTELKVISVNISKKKGEIKLPVSKIVLNAQGVVGDAHAGDWHRQVSILGKESFDAFQKQAGRMPAWGEFAENITTEGMEVFKTHPGDRFTCGKVVLEVTQIGKKCHGDGCAIFREVGSCVMPKEGIFTRVIHAGTILPGDILEFSPKVYKALVVTLSERASSGVYEDLSGPAVIKQLESYFSALGLSHDVDYRLIPDNEQLLREVLTKAKNDEVSVVITTGGTGVGPRDITPEVVSSLLDKEIPGIMEMIRLKYGAEKPNALLSRGVAGLMGETFVYTLPGSVKAVNEYMDEITKTLHHLFIMRMGIDAH